MLKNIFFDYRVAFQGFKYFALVKMQGFRAAHSTTCLCSHHPFGVSMFKVVRGERNALSVGGAFRV